MAKQIVRNYLIFRFISILPVSLLFATYVLFLKENQMTLMEIGFINVSYMLSIFLFEIPTGVVADIFGRKISILIGMAITSVSLLIYFFTYNFTGFIIAEVIMAFGTSFVSGALDAWVKDSLSHNGVNKKMGGIFSKGEILQQVAIIIGGTSGALLANVTLRYLWLVSALFSAISILPAYFLLKEEYFVRRSLTFKSSLTEIKKIATDSILHGFNNKIVRRLIIVSSLFLLTTQGLNMLWSLVAEERLGIWSLSFIWPGICLFVVVGLFITKKY